MPKFVEAKKLAENGDRTYEFQDGNRYQLVGKKLRKVH